jgi:hypothetical protein
MDSNGDATLTHRISRFYAAGLVVFAAAVALYAISRKKPAPPQVASAPAAATADMTGTADSPAADCPIIYSGWPLPLDLRETSGIAVGRNDTTVFWSHNDSGGKPEIFGFNAAGQIQLRIPVENASATDWEDMQPGPCGGDHCLYIADTGDNNEKRNSVTIYQLREPNAASPAPQRANAIRLQYPEGPRDAEALFITPNSTVYVVSKGRKAPIALYRVPTPLDTANVATLIKVRDLFPAAVDIRDRATSASASPDGKWVGIRTYRHLYLYPADALTSNAPVDPIRIDLAPVGEMQGEGLSLGNDGSVWLTSEAEDITKSPVWSRLKCSLPQ